MPPKLIPSQAYPRRQFWRRLGCAALACKFTFRGVAEADARQPDTTWNGDSWDGWMTVDGANVPDNWTRRAGVIHLRKSEERTGHIVTRKEYGDFRLNFHWKIAPGGNSGIKYRVRRYDDRMLGCEYQIYDAAGREVDARNRTGAIYDLYAPPEDAAPLPAGEWNQGVIRVHENQIEHWLNGRLIVSATIGDQEWTKRIAESKFNDVPKFAEAPRGRIMLTDHGSEVWYRNLEFFEE